MKRTRTEKRRTISLLQIPPLDIRQRLPHPESEEEPIVHLHVMLGSPSGGVIGGHLLRAFVFTTAEIMIGKLAGSSALRVKSDVTELMELLKR